MLEKIREILKRFFYNPDFDDSGLDRMSDQEQEQYLHVRRSVPFTRCMIQKIKDLLAGYRANREGALFKASVTGLILALFAGALISWTDKATVPDVSGLSFEEAQTVLEEHHFEMTIGDDVNSNYVPIGMVAYDEQAGERVKKGSSITVHGSIGRLITLTDLTSLNEDEATSWLETQGLMVVIDAQYDEDAEKGMIISQSTAEGETLNEGETVSLVVSLGSKPFKLRDYTGKTKAKAKKALKKHGLTVKINKTYSDTVEKGCVIYQIPAAGSMVVKGEEVTLMISQGVEQVTIPYVVGKDYETAVNTLHSAGLKTGTAYSQYSDTVAEGKVISQSRWSGSVVEKGTYVTLTVSLGKEKVPETEKQEKTTKSSKSKKTTKTTKSE